MVPDLRALQARQRLFLTLARLLQAGIEPTKALRGAVVDWPSQRQKPWQQAASQLATGRSMTQLRRLWWPQEAAWLAVADVSGTWVGIFERLSDEYQQQTRNMAQLQGRLWAPLAIFAVGLVALVLPAVLSGACEPLWCLSLQLVKFVFVFAMLMAFRGLFFYCWSGHQADVVYRLPVVGAWQQQRTQRQVVAWLAILLEAGIAAEQALRLIARLVPKSGSGAYLQAADLCAQGESLVLALQRNTLLPELVKRLRGAEAAGELVSVLRRYEKGLLQQQQLFWLQLIEWLPRLLYVLLLGVLLGSSS